MAKFRTYWTWETLCWSVKLYNRHLWHETLPHIFACASSLVFEEKQVFLNLTIFFILTNNDILTKVIRKYVKSKGTVALESFLDFLDVTSYLTFKIPAWKRGCALSFELQMPQTSSTPFCRAFTKFTEVSKKRNLSTACIVFRDDPWNFLLFLLLKLFGILWSFSD